MTNISIYIITESLKSDFTNKKTPKNKKTQKEKKNKQKNNNKKQKTKKHKLIADSNKNTPF